MSLVGRAEWAFSAHMGLLERPARTFDRLGGHRAFDKLVKDFFGNLQQCRRICRHSGHFLLA